MLSEVTDAHFEAYSNLRGVGNMKIEIVKEQLDRYRAGE